MNTRTIVTAASLLWALAAVFDLQSQEIGSSNSASADPGLYRSIDTPIKIRPSFRQENDSEDDDSEGYSPYSGEPEEPAQTRMAPTPQEPIYEPEPVREEESPVEKVVNDPVARTEVPVEEKAVEKEKPRPPTTLEETFEPVEVAVVDRPVPGVSETHGRPEAPTRLARPASPMGADEPRAVRRNYPVIPAPPIPAKPAPKVGSNPVAQAQRVPITEVYNRPSAPSPMSVDPLPKAESYSAFGASIRDIDPGPTVENLRSAANILANRGVPYHFGRNHPAFGGLDSPGAVQHILTEIGVNPVPRSMLLQQTWLRINHVLHEFRYRPSVSELSDHLIPGSLIFWGDYQTGEVTHVMIYLGYDASRAKYLAFGTRGGREVGIHGNEVDIFELKLDRERIIATGRIPGITHH